MKHPAWLSRPLKGQTVECLACSHYCKIPPGKTGICGVRYNDNGQLQLLVYGRPGAINTDPIEKKPLFHFDPGSQIFSIGTVGCNFSCLFCQNWELSQGNKGQPKETVEASGIALSPKEAVDYCLNNKIPAIAFTYNEPAIFFEYAFDTAKLAKEHGLKTVYVSNGFESEEALDKMTPWIDAINIDLKGPKGFYHTICGGRIEPIQKNIERLWKDGMWVEVTTLLIPGHNDSDEELKAIADFLVSISPDMPWHLSRYFPCYKMDAPPTPLASLERAYGIGKKAGLKYVYVGNVQTDYEHTFCPKCHKKVIERKDYLVHNHLRKDACPKCGEVIAGRFGNLLQD
ncbi:AmmeMemoRadiSam system radical SAM enzyme [Candidatus Peregrinibacteria bacterium]|nr:AmmeMemoRadiSam system radical SAM enzyme [Candidatus Peregrinibacteria bacterium]